MKRRITACLVAVMLLGGLFSSLGYPVRNAQASTVLTGYSASEIVSLMGRGWNLGNTFDSTGGSSVSDFETSWGNPKVTSTLINGVKAAGFDTIRIPVTWYRAMSSDGSYTIDSAYLARVKTIIDYAYSCDMFVILDIHHEEWVNTTELVSNYENIAVELKAVWTQLAEYFGNYDQHLIFEGMNEPRYEGADNEWTGDEAAYQVINYLDQLFVSTVRSSTKGYNYERCLMIPGYAASNSSTVLKSISIPTANGEADPNVIISVHCYSPYSFCLSDTQTTFDASNSSDTSDIDRIFSVIDEEFLSQGIPVVIGECSATNSGGNTSARAAWAKYIGAKSASYGVPVVFWDNGYDLGSGGESHSYINRSTGKVKYQSILDAFDAGYSSVTAGSGRSTGKADSLIGMNVIWQNTSGTAITSAWSNTFVSVASDSAYYSSSGSVCIAYKGSSGMRLILDSESAGEWWMQVEPDSVKTVNGYKVAVFGVSSILTVLSSYGITDTAVLRNLYPISSGTGNTVYEIAYTSAQYDVYFKNLGVGYSSGSSLPADPSFADLIFCGWYTTKDYREGTELSISGLTENVTAYAKYVYNTGTVSVSPSELILPINSTAAAAASATDGTAISWSSLKPSVATVDENGNVTAVAYGTAKIVAKSTNGDMAYVTVKTLFTDVTGSSDKTAEDYQYYYKPVYWAADNSVTLGMGDGSFGVGQDCTRMQVMMFLWRIAGKPEPDKDASEYFSDADDPIVTGNFNKAIAWAYENGIAKGYSDGSFGITRSISRVEVMIMLYRLAGKPSIGSTQMKFSDCTGYAKTSDTYKAIIWGTENKITAGYSDGTFRPSDSCLREQIVTFLYRYMN